MMGSALTGPRLTRRALMIGGGALAIAAKSSAAPRPRPRRSRLILLGTKGGPTPSKARAPAADLLMIDGEPYLIDCPDGTSRQLALADVQLPALRFIFISHLHSDHMAGLGALLLLAWGAGLDTPITILGPPGLAKIVDAELAAGAPDIEYRMREEGRADLRSLVRSVEIHEAGPIADLPVRVSCAWVNHYTVPTLAYRFDTPDRSFVFSGDTAPSPALIRLASGADVLVHEAMLESAIGRIANENAPDLREHLLKSHTTTDDLGRIAAAARVKTLVLTHLVPAFPDITDDQWAAGVRRHFHGKIIVGRDLMEI